MPASARESLRFPAFFTVSYRFISGAEHNNTSYIISQNRICNVFVHVCFLRPATGNRRARSCGTYSPQLATVRPAIGKRGFITSRTTFYTMKKRKKQQEPIVFLTTSALYRPLSAAPSAGCRAAVHLCHNGLRTLS